MSRDEESVEFHPFRTQGRELTPEELNPPRPVVHAPAPPIKEMPLGGLESTLLKLSCWAMKVEVWHRSFGDIGASFITGTNRATSDLDQRAWILAKYYPDYIYKFVDEMDDMLFDNIFDNAEALAPPLG